MCRNALFSVLVLCLISSFVWGFGGDLGSVTEPLTDGSESYPYLIEDYDDFQAFIADSGYWDDHVRLDCDLDLAVVNNLSMDSAWIYANKRDKLPEKLDNLPNNHPYCSITTPEGVKSGTVKLNFTLYDNEDNMVRGIFEYSINDGPWKTATQWTGPEWCDINNLTTTKAGKPWCEAGHGGTRLRRVGRDHPDR